MPPPRITIFWRVIVVPLFVEVGRAERGRAVPLPSRSEMRAACGGSVFAIAASRSGSRRTRGPPMPSAATTCPSRARTGTATAMKPGSSSSIAGGVAALAHAQQLAPQRRLVGDRARGQRGQRRRQERLEVVGAESRQQHLAGGRGVGGPARPHRGRRAHAVAAHRLVEDQRLGADAHLEVRGLAGLLGERQRAPRAPASRRSLRAQRAAAQGHELRPEAVAVAAAPRSTRPSASSAVSSL